MEGCQCRAAAGSQGVLKITGVAEPKVQQRGSVYATCIPSPYSVHTSSAPSTQPGSHLCEGVCPCPGAALQLAPRLHAVSTLPTHALNTASTHATSHLCGAVRPRPDVARKHIPTPPVSTLPLHPLKAASTHATSHLCAAICPRPDVALQLATHLHTMFTLLQGSPPHPVHTCVELFAPVQT